MDTTINTTDTVNATETTKQKSRYIDSLGRTFLVGKIKRFSAARNPGFGFVEGPEKDIYLNERAGRHVHMTFDGQIELEETPIVLDRGFRETMTNRYVAFLPGKNDIGARCDLWVLVSEWEEELKQVLNHRFRVLRTTTFNGMVPQVDFPLDAQVNEVGLALLAHHEPYKPEATCASDDQFIANYVHPHGNYTQTNEWQMLVGTRWVKMGCDARTLIPHDTTDELPASSVVLAAVQAILQQITSEEPQQATQPEKEPESPVFSDAAARLVEALLPAEDRELISVR